MKIRALLLPVIVVVLTAAAFPADPPDFTIQPVGDGVYAATSGDGSKAGSNAGFIVGTRCVAVVDTFVSPAAAKELMTEIHKITDLPVRYVINTHYHLDHTGGNAVFAEAGATIIAHGNVRGWLRTENLKFFGPTPKPEDKAMVEALVLPDVVYTDGLEIDLGSKVVQVRYMLGHTGGDSVVFVPSAKVVFTGDLFWEHHLPNLIDASTEPWIQTLDKLLAEQKSATFVSGHGGLGVASDVRDFRGYLIALREAVGKAQSEGKSGADLQTAAAAALSEKYGKWGFYEHFVKRNIDQTAAELKGSKKIPVAK